MLTLLRLDLVVALRGFRRTPAFVAAVLATLTLAIGMSVAMIATIQAVLIHRLPVADQDRVVVMWPSRMSGAEMAPPVADLEAVRRESRTTTAVAGVAHYMAVDAPYLDADRTLTQRVSYVSTNYFDVLGAHPVLGRFFRPDEGERGASSAMVLSYEAWQSRFGGSPSVIGRRLTKPWTLGSITIVGVAPPGLDYPVGTDCWVQLGRQGEDRVFTVARLAAGATPADARREFLAIMQRAEPGTKFTAASVEPFAQAILGQATPILVMLAIAVGLLLLIACVNIGSLFLVRAGSRAHELAVRRALGASRGALMRQLTTESFLLAVTGGLAGVAFGSALLHWLVAAAPSQLPRIAEIPLDRRLLGIAIVVTSGAILLFGVLPALLTTRANVPLRFDTRSGGQSRGRKRVRDSLVALQLALALVLLAGAGLLTRSLERLEEIPLGYRSDHLTVASFEFNQREYDTIERQSHLVGELARHIRSAPGVIDAAPMFTPLFGGADINHGVFEVDGESRSDIDAIPATPSETVGADFFRTLGVPIQRGRGFADTDDARGTPVVIVSQSAARRYWPREDAIGKRIRFSPDSSLTSEWTVWRTVVGVVPDVHVREFRETSPTVYFPWRQTPLVLVNFAVRSAVDASTLSTELKQAFREVDPTLTLWQVKSVDSQLGEHVAEPRLVALLVTLFGVVSLALATVGLYGVVASVVRDRTREIGIRMALGSTAQQVRASVLGDAMLLCAVGVTVGLAGSLFGARAIRSLLFEVSPADPLTLLGACVVLFTVALVAALIPAQRAARIDPVQALRAN